MMHPKFNILLLMLVTSIGWSAQGPKVIDTTVDDTTLSFPVEPVPDPYTGQQAFEDIDYRLGLFGDGTLDGLGDTSMGDVNSRTDGALVSWNAATGSYVPKVGTSDVHPLVSETHADTDGIGTEEYGDTLMWNGDAWVPGTPSGEYGIDLKFVSLAGYADSYPTVWDYKDPNGVVYHGTDEDGSLIPQSIYDRFLTPLIFDTGIYPGEPPESQIYDLPDGEIFYSGQLPNGGHNGTHVYKLADFKGDGINPVNIRYIHVRGCISMHQDGANEDQHAVLKARYPDHTDTLHSEHIIAGKTADVAENEFSTGFFNVAIPVNPGQSTLVLKWLLNIYGQGKYYGRERVQYQIYGVTQVVRTQQAPKVSTIHFAGSSDLAGPRWYVDHESDAGYGARIWDSSTNIEKVVPDGGSLQSIFPIELPKDTTMTEITAHFSNRYLSSPTYQEDWAELNITIDWSKDQVYGTWQYSVGSASSHLNGGVFKGTVNDVEVTCNMLGRSFDLTDNVFPNGTFPQSLGLGNREIIRLPVFGNLDTFTYMIKNYSMAETQIVGTSLSTGVKGLPQFTGRARGAMPGEMDGFCYINGRRDLYHGGADSGFRNGGAGYVHGGGMRFILPDPADYVTKAYITREVFGAMTQKNELYFRGANQYNKMSISGASGVPLMHPAKCTVPNVKKLLLPRAIIASSVEDKACCLYLTHDGELWGAGYNYHGQMGLGHNINVINGAVKLISANNAPEGLWAEHVSGRLGEGLTVVDVVNAGTTEDTIVALISDGTLRTCGYGGQGQLGIGTTDSHNTWQEPTSMIIEDIEEIQTCVRPFLGHTYKSTFFAKKRDGKLYCWGGNVGRFDGNTDPTPASITSPTVVAYNVTRFWAGNSRNTLIYAQDDTTQKLWGVGWNDSGYLGVGNRSVHQTITELPQSWGNDSRKIQDIVLTGGYYSSYSEYADGLVVFTDTDMYSAGWNKSNWLMSPTLSDTAEFLTSFTQCYTGLDETPGGDLGTPDNPLVVDPDNPPIFLTYNFSVVGGSCNTYMIDKEDQMWTLGHWVYHPHWDAINGIPNPASVSTFVPINSTPMYR